MLDAQEMRRRWSDKTSAVFSRSEYKEEFIYGPSDRELDVDFQNCRSIVFMDGEGRRGGEDLLLMARGSGHVSLPVGVQVRVVAGSVKISQVPVRSGSSAVGSSYGPAGGYRAPPPSRATSAYAQSSASSASGYRTPQGGASQAGFRGPSPPRDGASFNRSGSHVGSYASARRVPLPQSVADDFEVVEELEAGEWDMDTRSVAPSESVSSVGTRGMRAAFY